MKELHCTNLYWEVYIIMHQQLPSHFPSPKGEVAGVVEKCTQRPVHTVAVDAGSGA